MTLGLNKHSEEVVKTANEEPSTFEPVVDEDLDLEGTDVTTSEEEQTIVSRRKEITALMFVGLFGAVLLVYALGAAFFNAYYELAAPIDLEWPQKMLEMVLVAFLSLLAQPRIKM